MILQTFEIYGELGQIEYVDQVSETEEAAQTANFRFILRETGKELKWVSAAMAFYDEDGISYPIVNEADMEGY